MKYRPEIDGLRAISVIPVILFHAGFSGFEGGFVGVDVFFVISGYLIGNIILSELHSGKFSFLNFYKNRIKRLLPALLFTILTTFPLIYIFYLPSDFISFRQSIIYILTFN